MSRWGRTASQSSQANHPSNFLAELRLSWTFESLLIRIFGAGSDFWRTSRSFVSALGVEENFSTDFSFLLFFFFDFLNLTSTECVGDILGLKKRPPSSKAPIGLGLSECRLDE